MKNSVSFNSKLSKFGMGLFETIKVTTYPLDLDLHIERLFNSSKELNFSIKEDKEFYKNVVLEYVKDNHVVNKALRLTVFDEGYNISLRDISYDENTYKRGFSLCVSPIKRGDSIINRHKTTNYFESMYSKQYATENGFDDAVFLDLNDNILECSMSNIFFIKEGKIYTPKKTAPILNGIMKLNVENICKKLGIDLVECDINISDIDKFEAAFVTNSLMGIMPVVKFNKKVFCKDNSLIEILNKNL